MPEPHGPPQAPSPKPPGADGPPVLGDFEILDRIGQGGMGTVFKARQRSMDRLVAVKVLRPALASDAAYVERFWREARAAARLSHPNIVLAITAGEDHGYYYFVMEYVEGHTVGLLLKAGPLAEQNALRITLQIARALDYAWSKERIVHRDIKPGNILITPDGTAKLADLGLAHEVTLEDEDAFGADRKILGTPHYIAPEQIQRRPDLDVRCDLYALGATLFHMVTGRAPFEGRNTKALLNKHLREPAPDPRELRPELSDGLARILQKLLAKDRDDRYPDAKNLAADIEAVLRGESLGVKPLPPPRLRYSAARSSNLAPSIVGTLLLVFGLIVLVVIAFRALTGPPEPPKGRRDPTPRERPPEDPRLQAAERAWRAAESYAQAHPADAPGAIARLRDVESVYPGTPAAESALTLRHQLEADLERSNKEALAALVARAEALVAETRYADALALFDKLPPGLAAKGWRERAAAARAAAEKQAREAFLAALARGDTLARSGQTDEAVRAYEAAGAALPDSWRAEVAQRIADARRAQKELAERARAEREVARLRLLGELMDLYRARKYDEAAERLKGLIETAPAETREELKAELAEVAKLQDLWARTDRGASRMVGQRFVIRGIQGELVAVKGTRLTIRTPGGSFSEEIRNLNADQILALVLPELTSLEGPVAAARFLIAEGNLEAAAKRLQPLGDVRSDVVALRARLQRFESVAALLAALKELEEARALVAGGDPDRGAAALRAFLARFGKRPDAAALCLEAERLLQEAAAPRPPRWGHVGGRAVARPDARVRGTPDDPLYLTERHGLSAYRIAVPNGTYLVRLHFAETSPGVTGIGQRVFSVTCEGRAVLRDLDILRETNDRRFTALVKEFSVEVADGELTIEFIPKLQDPVVNAIEVAPQAGGAPILINCGAPRDYQDRSGRTWQRDQEYAPSPPPPAVPPPRKQEP